MDNTLTVESVNFLVPSFLMFAQLQFFHGHNSVSYNKPNGYKPYIFSTAQGSTCDLKPLKVQ